MSDRIVVLGCKTMAKELMAAMEKTACTYPVRWIESGLHNVPDLLRKSVQEQIDACEDCDHLLMAMGFCGNAVAGLQAREAELILPRADDCISILCGSQQERLKFPDAYFFTEGWLRGEQTIWREYEYTVKKYGERRAKQIFQAMLRHYRRCALLDTGCFDVETVGKEVSHIAAELGLTYQVIPGTISFLCELLTGPWTEEHFLIIPPHGELKRNLLFS